MNEYEMIKKKCEFFKGRNKPIYFKLIISDQFRNGTISEILNDSLVLDEVEMGTILIYYKEIQEQSLAESKHWRFKNE